MDVSPSPARDCEGEDVGVGVWEIAKAPFLVFEIRPGTSEIANRVPADPLCC